MKRFVSRVFFVSGALLLAFFLFLFVGEPVPAESITWGVNFSQKQAGDLGLDWRAVYTALLDDLRAKNLKIAMHWDLLEPQEGRFSFEDLDWQMDGAKEHGAKVMAVIGMKTTRWPECHIPAFAKNLSRQEQQDAILAMLSTVVERYKDHPSLSLWQVENEPFFPFGECPWASEVFLKKEVSLVQSLDDAHPVVISDSGEGSFWLRAARNGDIVATTLYQKAWFRQLGIYVDYPFPPVFYKRKAEVVNALFGKEVLVGELQAEPWGPKLLQDISLQEQAKTMNLRQFQENIAFAKETGLDTFYLWGAEWLYWLKEVHGNDSLWQEAKKLLSE